jgi:hypothetical protein
MGEVAARDAAFETRHEAPAEPDVSAVPDGPSASFSSDAVAVDGSGAVVHVNGHDEARPEVPTDVVSGPTSAASLSALVSSAQSDPVVSLSEASQPAASVAASGSTEQEGSLTDRSNTPVSETHPVQGDQSLLTLSTTATLVNILTRVVSSSLEGEATIILPENGHDGEQTQELEATQLDHPEPPPSLTASAASTTYADAYEPVKPETKGPKVPAANRLSISYEGGNRRIVFDAEVVDTMTLFRHEARAEVRINLTSDGEGGLKGILVKFSLFEYHFVAYRLCGTDGNSLRCYKILPSNPIYGRF